jgi:hypothetical protein
MQSLPIINKALSSNIAVGNMYATEHYVIKFDFDVLQVGVISGT